MSNVSRVENQGNPFAALAERQICAPLKAHRRAVEKRQAAREEKMHVALDERDTMFRLWKQWRSEKRDALLAGPYGRQVRELIRFLQTMQLDQAGELIALIERGPWHSADRDTRFEVLCLIDRAITALCERNGLPPFDDALPDQPPNAFLVLREALS